MRTAAAENSFFAERIGVLRVRSVGVGTVETPVSAPADRACEGRVVARNRGVFVLLVETEGAHRSHLFDPGFVHLRARGDAELLADGHGQIGQDARGPSGFQRVEGGFLHAVRLGYSDHVDLLDLAGAKDLLEEAAVGVAALKARIGGLILAFLHGGVDWQRGDGLVKLGLGRSRECMRGPCVDEIRLLRKVRTRVDVPVLGGDDHRVLVGVLRDKVCDPLGRRVSSLDGQRSAFAERRLDVDNDECPCLGHVLPPNPRRA